MTNKFISWFNTTRSTWILSSFYCLVINSVCIIFKIHNQLSKFFFSYLRDRIHALQSPYHWPNVTLITQSLVSSHPAPIRLFLLSQHAQATLYNPAAHSLLINQALTHRYQQNPLILPREAPKKKKIVNYPLTLNHSRFLNKSPWSANAASVINALHHIGKDHITDDMLNKCRKILTQRDKSQLNNNLKQLPWWMIPYILKMTRKNDERDAKSK